MGEHGRAVWSVLVATTIAASLWSLVPATGSVPTGCCLPMNGSCQETDMGFCELGLNGTFVPGELCGNASTCRPAATGCCDGFSMCLEGELDCRYMGNISTFVPDGSCQPPGNGTMNVSVEFCVPPTETPSPVPPTETPSPVPPTDTPSPVPPTDTPSPVPPTDTPSPVPPTDTPSPVPPTDTPSPVPPTDTPTPMPDGADCVDPDDCMSGNCIDDVCCDSVCDGALEACNLVGSEGTCSPTTAEAPAASDNVLIAVVAMLIAIGLFAVARRRTA